MKAEQLSKLCFRKLPCTSTTWGLDGPRSLESSGIQPSSCKSRRRRKLFSMELRTLEYIKAIVPALSRPTTGKFKAFIAPHRHPKATQSRIPNFKSRLLQFRISRHHGRHVPQPIGSPCLSPVSGIPISAKHNNSWYGEAWKRRTFCQSFPGLLSRSQLCHRSKSVSGWRWSICQVVLR